MFFNDVNDLKVRELNFKLFNLVFHQSYFIICCFHIARGILIVFVLDSPEFFKTTIESCLKFGYAISAIASICRIFSTTNANHSVGYNRFAINFVSWSNILLKNGATQHF